jgi:hypothetical protein
VGLFPFLFILHSAAAFVNDDTRDDEQSEQEGDKNTSKDGWQVIGLGGSTDRVRIRRVGCW